MTQKKSTQIIISAASVAAAFQAISGAINDSTVLRTANETPYDDVAREATTSSQAQSQIRAAKGSIIKTIRINPAVLESPYAKVVASKDESGDWPLGVEPDLIESLRSGGSALSDDVVDRALGNFSLIAPDGMTKREYLEQVTPILVASADSLVTDGEENSVRDLNTSDDIDHLRDSTARGGLLNCYTNCHFACHGSRGWR